mmetsp:Transcript_6211/g.18641  ORF Transcript_6211/g.18641 Transcript_6211/m.18641 type:complete len:208 (+) Transcript_6211:382-1005(+)
MEPGHHRLPLCNLHLLPSGACGCSRELCARTLQARWHRARSDLRSAQPRGDGRQLHRAGPVGHEGLRDAPGRRAEGRRWRAAPRGRLGLQPRWHVCASWRLPDHRHGPGPHGWLRPHEPQVRPEHRQPPGGDARDLRRRGVGMQQEPKRGVALGQQGGSWQLWRCGRDETPDIQDEFLQGCWRRLRHQGVVPAACGGAGGEARVCWS